MTTKSKQKANQNAVLILGMHRSGTSCLTRCFNILGYDVPQNLIGINKANKSGHWESERVARINDEILAEIELTWDSWGLADLSLIRSERLKSYSLDIQSLIKSEFLESKNIVLKEPRICRLASMYIDALHALEFSTHIVFLFRNPIEVINSLKARNSMTKMQAALLWLRYNLDAELSSRNYPRSIIQFENIIQEPKENFSALLKTSNLKPPYPLNDVVSIMEEYIKPTERNHISSAENVINDKLLYGWVSDTYNAILVLSKNQNSKKAQGILDDIRTEFNSASPLMRKFIDCAEASAENIQSNNLELKNTLAEHEEMKRTLIDQHEALKRRTQTLEQTLESYSKSENDVRKELDIAKKQERALQQEMEAYKGKNKKTQLKCDRLEGQALTLQELVDSYSIKDIENKKERDELIKQKLNLEQVASAFADKDNDWQKERSSLLEKIEALRTSSQLLLEKKDASLGKAKAKLKKRTKTRHKLRKKLDETIVALKEKNDSYYKLEQMFDEIQTKHVDHKARFKLEIQALNQKYEQSIGERGQLESTLALRSKEYSELNVKFKDLEIKSKLLNQQLISAKDKSLSMNAALQNKEKELKKAIIQINERDAKLKEMRRITRNLQKDKWRFQDQLNISNDWLKAYQASNSWRVTAPIRAITTKIRKIKQIIAKNKFIRPEEQKPVVEEVTKSKKLSNHLITEEVSRKEDLKQIRLIEKSGFFDSIYYLAQYPKSQLSELKPVEHFFYHGWKLGYQPSSLFNTNAYLAANIGLKKDNICPLVHYIKNNHQELKLNKEITKRLGKIVVFTAIAGPYDDLKDPIVVSDDVDYVLFTDQDFPNMEVWKPRRFDHYFSETTRMARYIKTHPHVYFKDYDWAIWIDANLQMNCTAEELIYQHASQGVNFATWHHPLRNCVYDEAKECIKRDKDKDILISEQMSKYKAKNFPKQNGLFETSVYVTKPCDDDVSVLMNLWWAEILNGSRRDQLGLPVAINNSKVKLGYLAKPKVCMRSDPRFVYYRHT